ncbi:hypothetical protein IFM12275_23930 [Nocardia sputorum]|nr:hypothetical protein IFM12275_23930 [Nocardia sputorum]
MVDGIHPHSFLRGYNPAARGLSVRTKPHSPGSYRLCGLSDRARRNAGRSSPERTAAAARGYCPAVNSDNERVAQISTVALDPIRIGHINRRWCRLGGTC